MKPEGLKSPTGKRSVGYPKGRRRKKFGTKSLDLDRSNKSSADYDFVDFARLVHGSSPRF
jgi:hypothetical protein